MWKPRTKKQEREKAIVSSENRVSNIAKYYRIAKSGYLATLSNKKNLYSQNFFKDERSSVGAQIYIAQRIAVELPEALNSTASGMVKSILGGVTRG